MLSPNMRSVFFQWFTAFLAFESLFINQVAAAANLRWATRILSDDNVHDTPSSRFSSSSPSSVSSSSSLSPSSSAFAAPSSSLVPRQAPSTGISTMTTCNPEFFDPKHFADSGAAEWYANWTVAIDKNSPAWTDRISEPRYFAEQQLAWMDLDCGVTHKGCINMPNCDEILERVGGDGELARKMYYVLQSYHNMNLIAGVISEQSLNAETNVIGMAASLSHTFFWRFDQGKQDKCEMLASFVKTVQSAVMVVLLFAIPVIGPLGAVAVQDAAMMKVAGSAGRWVKTGKAPTFESGFRGARQEAADKLYNKSNRRMQEPKKDPKTWQEKVPEKAAEPWNDHVLPMSGQTIPNALNAFPIMLESPAVNKGVCGMYPNAPKDAEQVHNRDLGMLIQRTVRAYRSQVDSNMAEINGGVGFGENGTFPPNDWSVMADQIMGGTFVGLTHKEHARFVDNPSLIEQDMTNTFKNTMISAALKSQMCHIHCSSDDSYSAKDGSGKCADELLAAHGEVATTRFCPAPRTMCQAQCWRNSVHAKNIALFGLDEVSEPGNNWDMDLVPFLKGSYDHWQAHRFNQSQPFPSIKDLMEDTVETTSGSFLPVCYDESIKPQDFLVKKTKDNRALPCTCGDSYGNETAYFFREAGFESWVDKDAHLGDRCQRNMDAAHVGPVENFMTLCSLNSHWPVYMEDHHQMYPGPDYHCTAMSKAVGQYRADGLSSHEINCKICFDSDLGKVIQQQQKGRVDKAHGFSHMYANMKNGCKRLNKEKPCPGKP